MIVTYPDPILELALPRCDPTGQAAMRVAGKLWAVLEEPENSHAVAIAANQLGYAVRMFAYRDRDQGIAILSNPEVTRRSKRMKVALEGCLSFPGEKFRVSRSVSIDVRGHDVVGDVVNLSVHGFQARMFQHEIDHLDGILVRDHVLTAAFDRLTP